MGRPLTAADDTVLETVLRRDRQAVVAALVAVIAMAWVWILFGAGTGMSAIDVIVGSSPDHMASIMAPALWTAGYAGIMFTMWWVMMAAMMLPSAVPILLLFARISHGARSRLVDRERIRGQTPPPIGPRSGIAGAFHLGERG